MPRRSTVNVGFMAVGSLRAAVLPARPRDERPCKRQRVAVHIRGAAAIEMNQLRDDALV